MIINDSIEIASIVGADGVHLGLKDGDLLYARRILGKEAIIGATAHNLMEAQMAWAAGADYLGCGAMFGSKTKRRTVALTIEKLTEICEKLPIPVVAIGGINCENMMQLKGIGIAGAAVVSAIFDQEDIRTATAALDTVMTKMMQQ